VAPRSGERDDDVDNNYDRGHLFHSGNDDTSRTYLIPLCAFIAVTISATVTINVTVRISVTVSVTISVTISVIISVSGCVAVAVAVAGLQNQWTSDG
jgi:hypothetical protein